MTAAVVIAYPAGSAQAAEEAPKLAAAGIARVLLDAESLQLHTLPESGSQLLWRGGALDATGYARLELAITAQGHRLMTSPQDYLRAHHLPGWVAALADQVAETRVVPMSHVDKLASIAAKLGWWPLLLRDYVQPAGLNTFAHGSADLPPLLAALQSQPGGLQGGVALQRGEPYQPGSARRFFVWHQNVWPHPDAPEEAAALARLVTRHFWHLFYTVDVVQRADGRWRVLGLDDAQAAGLGEWPAAHFAECLRLSLDPSRA